MDTEIELKLLVAEQDLSRLTAWLDNCPEVMKHYQKTLSNNYFDTPTRQLRALDCGLRVRTIDGRSEQTLKTSGKVIAGLHQRPECNIAIDGLRPDLFLFNRNVWGENIDLAELQNSLNSMFSTNFSRKTWLLGFKDESVIEVVLDFGEVSSGENSIPICEMEFELVKGQPSVLFEFAQKLTFEFQLRLGQESKAAAGYRLLDGAPKPHQPSFPTLKINPTQTIEATLSQLVGAAIKHIQSSEDAFYASSELCSLQEIRHGLIWLLQIQKYFKSELPEHSLEVLSQAQKWLPQLDWVVNAAYTKQILAEKDLYMKKLEDKKQIRNALKIKKSQNDLERKAQAQQMLASIEYRQWFLSLVQWLVCSSWRVEGESLPTLERSTKDLAQQILSASHSQTLHLFTENDVLQNCECLKQMLISSHCFQKTFTEDLHEFHAVWRDLLKGCQELALLQYLQNVAQKLELVDQDAFERWLDRKQQSWKDLIEQSKKIAQEITLYWN